MSFLNSSKEWLVLTTSQLQLDLSTDSQLFLHTFSSSKHGMPLLIEFPKLTVLWTDILISATRFSLVPTKTEEEEWKEEKHRGETEEHRERRKEGERDERFAGCERDTLARKKIGRKMIICCRDNERKLRTRISRKDGKREP